MKIEIGLRLANIRKKWWYYLRWSRLGVMTTEWVQPQSEATCQRSRPSSAATSASLPIGWETIEQEPWECTSSSKQRGLSAFWTDSSRLHSLHFFSFLSLCTFSFSLFSSSLLLSFLRSVSFLSSSFLHCCWKVSAEVFRAFKRADPLNSRGAQRVLV